MKNVFKISLLAAAVVLTVGCNEKKEPVAAAVAIEAPATFANNQDKVAYAIGTSFSQQFNTMLAKQAELGMELDKEVVLQGITDTLRGSSKLTDDDIMTTLKAYGEEVKTAAEKQMKEKSEKAAEEAKSFLDENAKVEGVTVTESGLQYSVLTKAEGPKPKAEDTVTVHYVGTLLDGTEFDSSVKRGQPATFPLNRVIPGWTEGVQLMSVGEKYKFVIPADLAYGEAGAGSIPPSSTLIFEVELLDIKAATKEDAPK
ncbi:FKBP-type peptidyl-prolyl cis-trans isomerase [Psychromonas antarctica]|uniref:FKBP-type peptidyl-prolyl cis-trans isomerase n=1 Tax=Psychromonas antarctica TaxID=67573 RepID=UPI001EE8A763|nr:FKBP-type peptidyl-prolyl cis-trans isomerase [Psychromonas antarctica]MCG6200164.1 FKBP-type peptidyl-prolyl cis-trans isomerase [Psychromonas antarctica]